MAGPSRPGWVRVRGGGGRGGEGWRGGGRCGVRRGGSGMMEGDPGGAEIERSGFLPGDTGGVRFPLFDTADPGAAPNFPDGGHNC